MATGSLGGAWLKVERAKKHLRDLEVVLQGFFERNPYRVAIKDNAETGDREHTVVRAEALPRCVTLISGDVVHNLRSALDHVIRQLLIANGRDPKDYRAAFPIRASEAAYKASRPGDAKGVSQTALNIIDGLKPYKGGNDALWRLHQLDIVDKHRLLLTVAAAHGSVIIDTGAVMRKAFAGTPDAELVKDIPAAPIALRPANRVKVEKGVVLFASRKGDETHDDVKFSIDVALNEPEIVESEPVIPALQQLVGLVEEVISLFEPLMTGR